MSRPQVDVTVTVGLNATYSVEMLRSYVTSLLLPLVDTCDIHITAIVQHKPTETEPTRD